MKEVHKTQIDDEKIVIYGNYIKILTIIACIVAAISLMIFLLALNLKVTVINPNFYKENLKKSDTYQKLLSEGIPSLITGVNFSQDESINLLARQGINYIITKAIPASWVQKQTETLIDKVANFLGESHTNPAVTLQLNDMNIYMAQINDGLTILEQLIPSCADASKDNTVLKQLLNTSIDCNNLNYNLDDIKTTIAKTKTEISKLQVTQMDITSKINQAYDALGGIQHFVRNVNIYFWTSLILFLLMIILIVLMQLKNVFAMLRYLSYPIIIGSILVFICSLIAKNVVLAKLDANLSMDINPAIQAIVNDFARVSVTNIFTQIELSSGILAGIGLTLLILVWSLHHDHKNNK